MESRIRVRHAWLLAMTIGLAAAARARVKDGGTFLQPETIDAWHPIRTSDLMRRLMGVKLIDSSGVVLAASTRGWNRGL